LDDPVNLAAVTKINKQIAGLARVLNSPTMENLVTAKSSNEEVPVASMAKQRDGATYLFSVAMRNDATKASFSGKGLPRTGKVEVLGESRSIPIQDGHFTDDFTGYGVHLYRIRADRTGN